MTETTNIAPARDQAWRRKRDGSRVILTAFHTLDRVWYWRSVDDPKRRGSITEFNLTARYEMENIDGLTDLELALARWTASNPGATVRETEAFTAGWEART